MSEVGHPHHPHLVEKSRSKLRWVILLLGCLMMVGSYYCFDIPAALKTQIDDYMGDPSDYELDFSLLYTLYAAPNVILPFFGGYLVDRIGIDWCLLLFSSLIALGQVIFAFGLSIKSWPVIFIGRLVFGFGGESFTVANSALLADWFKGRELAFAFGINLSISKLGSVINNLLSPMLADSVSITFALWFGSILCGFGIVCVLLTMPIDRAMDAKIAKYEEYIALHAVAADDHEQSPLDHPRDSSPLPMKTSVSSDEDSEHDTKKIVAPRTTCEEVQATVKDVKSLPPIFWILVISCAAVYGCILPFNNISSSLLQERNYFQTPSSSCQLTNPYQCESDLNPPENCPSSHWYKPPLPYNYTGTDGTVYNPLEESDIDCTKDEWKDGCTKEYCDRLNKAESEASVVMSIPYIISACLSPPLGFFVDFFGFRAVIAAIAPLILIIVHLFLGLTKVNPIGPLVGQGLAYTGFVSVLWPSVPLVVEEELTGLAFGIVTSVQNLACAVIPLIIASIYSQSGDKYIPNAEYLFVAFGVVGLLVGLYMNYFDITHNNILNTPHLDTVDPTEEAMLADTKETPLLEEVAERSARSSRANSSSRSMRVSKDGVIFHFPSSSDKNDKH